MIEGQGGKCLSYFRVPGHGPDFLVREVTFHQGGEDVGEPGRVFRHLDQGTVAGDQGVCQGTG